MFHKNWDEGKLICSCNKSKIRIFNPAACFSKGLSVEILSCDCVLSGVFRRTDRELSGWSSKYPWAKHYQLQVVVWPLISRAEGKFPLITIYMCHFSALCGKLSLNDKGSSAQRSARLFPNNAQAVQAVTSCIHLFR